MTRDHKRDPGPQVSPQVRELLRRDKAEVEFELALTHRESDIRMTLPVLCYEEFDEPPKWVDAYYLTGPRLFLVDLPDPGGDGQ